MYQNSRCGDWGTVVLTNKEKWASERQPPSHLYQEIISWDQHISKSELIKSETSESLTLIPEPPIYAVFQSVLHQVQTPIKTFCVTLNLLKSTPVMMNRKYLACIHAIFQPSFLYTESQVYVGFLIIILHVSLKLMRENTSIGEWIMVFIT